MLLFRGCTKLTTLPKELFDISTLTTLAFAGCNISRPPQAICEQGVDAMRRWWAELAAGASKSMTLKTVLMGAGEAGKTSVLRRWKDANEAVLPKVADRTIGVEMALLCIGENGEHFVVLDFGG